MFKSMELLGDRGGRKMIKAKRVCQNTPKKREKKGRIKKENPLVM